MSSSSAREIAGLAAGYFLREKRVLILEKESRPGGRARAGRFEGLPYAIGISCLAKPYGALKEIIEALKLNLREIPPPLHAYLAAPKLFSERTGWPACFRKPAARPISSASAAPSWKRPAITPISPS